MAKHDLYKTAQQSAKLFKIVKEDESLEPWVAKKIAKASSDIESVYQYLNFEKHFKEQEKAILSNESLSESAREELMAKLAEAKDKVAKMKIKAAKEKAKMDENAFDYKNKGDMKVGDTKKTRTGELTKTKTGVIHKNTSYSDEERGEVNDTHAKAKSAADKKKEAPAQKKSKTGTWGMEGGQKFDNRKNESMAEGKGKCSCDESKKSVKTCPVHGKMEEGLKGGQKKLDKNHNGKLDGQDFKMLRAGKKSVDEGKDEGKPGKNFKKIADKAAKEYGSKEAGERVAGAVRNKLKKAGKLEESSSKQSIRNAIARAQAILEEGKKKSSGKKPAWLEKAEVEAEEREGKKVSKAEEKKVGIVKESAELDAIKAITARVLKG